MGWKSIQCEVNEAGAYQICSSSFPSFHSNLSFPSPLHLYHLSVVSQVRGSDLIGVGEVSQKDGSSCAGFKLLGWNTAKGVQMRCRCRRGDADVDRPPHGLAFGRADDLLACDCWIENAV